MSNLTTILSIELARESKFSASSVKGFDVLPPQVFGGIDLCGALPEPARTLCKKIGGVFNGGGNGSFPDLPIKGPGDGCIFPLRRDPISKQCKIFLGTQVGPNGGPGEAVVGGFGLPAMTPDIVGQITKRDGTTGPILRCMKGMVLGIDSLCYPKAVMPRRSKFRKWRGAVRPAVSASDVKAIRRAAAAKERVLNLAKDVGLFASKTKPAPRPKAHQHLIAPPVQELRVISEHTN